MRVSILVAFGLVSTICSANTVDFNWNYTGTGIEAHGTFVTSTTGTAGEYLITAISGERNGAAITALDTTFGAPDELLFYPATNTGTDLTPTFLDNNGFSFDIGAAQYNIFSKRLVNRVCSPLDSWVDGGFRSLGLGLAGCWLPVVREQLTQPGDGVRRDP